MQSGLANGGLVDLLSSQRKTHKHHLDEQDDENDGETNGVDLYAQNGTQRPSKATTAEKRRKLGHWENGLDFEPKFHALSLKSATVVQDASARSALPMESSTDRFFASNNDHQAMPVPASVGDNTRPVSRKTASISTTKDSAMQIDPRFDPERPHVVFVDTLSDSEDDRTANSSTVTTDNELSASDLEDGHVVSPSAYGHSSRPLRLNKRLRQHLRKQQALKDVPILQGILTTPDFSGHVAERGLVLYRPLSWPIVQEPDDAVLPSDAVDAVRTQDVQIEELPSEGSKDEDEDAEMDID